jgi:Ca2+-binding EF-hand superfamily protein
VIAWKSELLAIKDRIGSEITTAEALEEKIVATFNELDLSADGFVDALELKVGMEAIGAKITDDTARRMIAEVDDNADEQVDMVEVSVLVALGNTF